jgi:hypothetical protein
VRILDVESVWNHTVYEVWIPGWRKSKEFEPNRLAPTQSIKTTGLDRIAYAVCAARIADALTQDVLLAPLEAGVIPLPHQLTLSRVRDRKIGFATCSPMKSAWARPSRLG